MDTTKKVYWHGALGITDDFGDRYGNVMYDAVTIYGKWANMTHKSWLEHCNAGRLGIGVGQKYEKQSDGRWLKVEG